MSSDSLIAFAKALCALQAEITNPPLDAENSYFDSRFTSLPALHDHLRKALPKHGFSYVQTTERAPEGGLTVESTSDIESVKPGYDEEGKPHEPRKTGERRSVANFPEYVVVTELLHVSGERRIGYFPIRAEKMTAQGLGSGTTSAKRYGLAAICGVAGDTDDDGEVADGRKGDAAKPAKKQGQPKPTPAAEPQAETPVAHLKADGKGRFLALVRKALEKVEEASVEVEPFALWFLAQIAKADSEKYSWGDVTVIHAKSAASVLEDRERVQKALDLYMGPSAE